MDAIKNEVLKVGKKLYTPFYEHMYGHANTIRYLHALTRVCILSTVHVKMQSIRLIGEY